MFIIFNDDIRFIYRRIKCFIISSLIIYCVLGCSSEKSIIDEEYEIYAEVLKYIHEIDDLNYQKFSHIILNENTVIPDDITRYPEVELSDLKLTYLLENCYINVNNMDSLEKNLKAGLRIKYPFMTIAEIESLSVKRLAYAKNNIVETVSNLESKIIIKDFISNNTSSFQIDKTFFFDVSNFDIMSRKEISRLLKTNLLDGDWSDFFKKYPESTGLLSFSRIGFNEQKTHAILYVEKNCGNKCGTGNYLFYYKTSDKWKVGSIFKVWTI